MKKLLLFLTISITAAFLLYAKAQQVIMQPQKVDGEVIFAVQKGSSLKEIADELYEKKLLKNPQYFVWYAKFKKIYPQIKAGEYVVDKDVNFEDLANILTLGKFYWRKVTIPEGLNVFQIKKILDENEFLSGETPDFSEGELLPETYTFMRGETRNNIVSQARKNMQNTLQNIWNGRAENIPLHSENELLILASIIEKETGIASERPQISAVFANRLKIGMRLQTDPSVIYAITKGERELGRPLLKKDLETDSPYNTYKYAGLPPKPICSPGKDAIIAAAHPDNNDFLYFVASGNGGHNFAKSLSEHNQNVNKWRQVQKQAK